MNIGLTNKGVQINLIIINFLTQHFYLKTCLSCRIRIRTLAEEAVSEIPRRVWSNHRPSTADNIDGILMQFTSNARVSTAAILIKEWVRKKQELIHTRSVENIILKRSFRRLVEDVIVSAREIYFQVKLPNAVRLLRPRRATCDKHRQPLETSGRTTKAILLKGSGTVRRQVSPRGLTLLLFFPPSSSPPLVFCHS